MRLHVQVRYYQDNSSIIKRRDDGTVRAEAKKSDYPESFLVSLSEKDNDTGAFTDILKDKRIPGTALPEASATENLEITMGQLRNAIESYINDTNASQIMTWPAYYRSSIYSAVRRRIGQAGMASLNEFFENKKAEKIRNSI